MDGLDLIFGNTFFEGHIVDMRWKPTELVVCHDGKEVIWS